MGKDLTYTFLPTDPSDQENERIDELSRIWEGRISKSNDFIVDDEVLTLGEIRSKIRGLSMMLCYDDLKSSELTDLAESIAVYSYILHEMLKSGVECARINYS